jgi:hypothetical protein
MRAISIEDGLTLVRFASRWSRCFCSASASCCASRSVQSCTYSGHALPKVCAPHTFKPGLHATFARDHEYKRHGTVSLLAGIDLLSGKVHALIRDHHAAMSSSTVRTKPIVGKREPFSPKAIYWVLVFSPPGDPVWTKQ